jgi:phosphohistidine phosphatase
LMLVGHRPFLERLTGRLVAHDESLPAVRFRRGTIACLRRIPKARSWAVHWVASPNILPGIGPATSAEPVPGPEWDASAR